MQHALPTELDYTKQSQAERDRILAWVRPYSYTICAHVRPTDKLLQADTNVAREGFAWEPLPDLELHAVLAHRPVCTLFSLQLVAILLTFDSASRSRSYSPRDK